MSIDAPTIDQMSPAVRGPLERWLAERLDARVRIVQASRPEGSGYSAETAFLDVVVDGDPRRVVVRFETDDPPVYPPQNTAAQVEIGVQHQVMAALAAHSDVPIAPLLGYEPDPAVLGTPFFAMEHVSGVVPVETPPYTAEGFFVDASPAARTRLVRRGLEVMAAVHAVDWQAAGLDWLAPVDGEAGTAHQLALWEGYARRELDGRHHPLLERAFEWLGDRLPTDSSVGLCWGDARPGNIIWRDCEPVCATDFEAASIASPDQDLGWWLMFDRWVHERAGVPRLEGEPSRDEQRGAYAEVVGRDVGDTTYHEVFAAARYAAIVIRVMNRSVERGRLPADHTAWLQNPATAVLEPLLDEAS